jgi:D-3-phosphoglycerate dehydrogenase
MILAKHNINIADFRLGRDEQGFALAVIIVDDDVNKEVLEELRNLKACISVAYAIL